jgi:hypothetical protein
MQRFIVLAVFVLALLCAATQVQARTEVCQEVSQRQIAALFDRWNASLKTGDPIKGVANYAPHSILWPTVSNKPRLSVREKENYFVHFLARRPVGRIDSRSIQTGCNWAVDAGLYTFRFADLLSLPGSALRMRAVAAGGLFETEALISHTPCRT